MDLTVLESKKRMLIKWFEEYPNIDSEQHSIFLNILDCIQNDLFIMYKMNEVLDKDIDRYEYKDDKMYLEFYLNTNDIKYTLNSSFGSIILDYYTFKTIISKIVDIYSEIYPLGTVVDINTKYLKHIIPTEDNESIRVVILNRFTMLTNEMFFYYTGVIYPIGNMGTDVGMIYFSPVTINKVVHMGYTDDKDKEFVLNKKKELLLDMGLHSTSIVTKNEEELVYNQAREL